MDEGNVEGKGKGKGEGTGKARPEIGQKNGRAAGGNTGIRGQGMRNTD